MSLAVTERCSHFGYKSIERPSFNRSLHFCIYGLFGLAFVVFVSFTAVLMKTSEGSTLIFGAQATSLVLFEVIHLEHRRRIRPH